MVDLTSRIEAILFAAGRPVKISELVRALDSDREAIIQAIDQLADIRGKSGIVVIRKDDRLQLATAPEYAKSVADFLNAEQRERLTDAAVETLAIVAYKQPITRAEIEAIRGVNSQYILRQLSIRGLVEKTASPDDSRRLVYRTTLEFMSHLGLRDMSELPAFEELTKSVQLPDAPPAEPTDRSAGENSDTKNTEQIPSEGKST